jgi:hypothetical protein
MVHMLRFVEEIFLDGSLGFYLFMMREDGIETNFKCVIISLRNERRFSFERCIF